MDDLNTEESGSSNGSNGKLSYEAMANHPDVKLAFNERIYKIITVFGIRSYDGPIDKFKLVHFCKLFLDNIVSSLPTMPFGLRWITKQLVVYVWALILVTPNNNFTQ